MSATPRLLTLALSHFCEKARWGLDRAGIAYTEEMHLPLLHRLRTRRVGASSVPVLLTDGRTLPDSESILRWADAQPGAERLYPQAQAARSEAIELTRYLDRELGVHSRRWAYGELLGHPALLAPCFTHGVGRIQRALSPAVLPLVRRRIRRGLRITPDAARQSLLRVESVFGHIDAKLADGRAYLLEEGFGVADLTFAALAAPVLLPQGYGGRLPALAELPDSARETILRLRATTSGRFALEMYARHRGAATLVPV